MKFQSTFVALFVGCLLPSTIPAQAGPECRQTKLIHSCSEMSQGSYYYSCYAVRVPCSVQKYSLEGIFSPLQYPIVDVQYYVPEPTALALQWSER